MNKKDVASLKQFFTKLVRLMETKAPYADILYNYTKETRINKDKTTINVGSEEDKGVKLRIFDGEKYLMYATSSCDKTELLKAAKELSSKIKPVKNPFKLKLDAKRLNKNFYQKGTIDPQTISMQEKIAFVKSLQDKLLTMDKELVNVRVVYIEEREEKLFVSSQKQLYQEIDSCMIITVPFVNAHGDIRYHYKSFLRPGYEVTKVPLHALKEVIEMAKRIKNAKKIKPGKYHALFSPAVTGLLAHESFGHGMESDTLYKGRAQAIEYLGKRIANSQVNILDNPSFMKRNGSFFFDDEGVITKPTYLVKKGIVTHPITESYSASKMNMRRSGNARAESFDHKPYARMSNTYFGPGRSDPKKMLAKIKNGMYLHYSSGGMEDPKGWGIQVQGIVAEKIKNGKLTGQLFYEIGMTGYLPTLLGNIQDVGKTLIVKGTGSCGKGHKEWVRVSEGGVHLLVKDVDLS